MLNNIISDIEKLTKACTLESMTLKHFTILYYLAENDSATLNLKELALVSKIETSTLFRALNRMEKNNLIKSSKNVSDKRETRYRTTVPAIVSYYKIKDKINNKKS